MTEEKQYQHKEAFCLMEYRCERCGQSEFFWNSRDGVTPFIVVGHCRACGGDLQHVNWRRDRCMPDYVPNRDQGVFFDMPESFKRTIAIARVDAHKGTRFELRGAKREQMIESIIAEFQPGAPWFTRW